MKRWVVVLLLALAVIVLVSPGIVGRLAEKNLKESLHWAESESEDIRVTEEAFDRGWFTAAGRYRIELEDGGLRAAVVEMLGPAGGADDGRVPALIIDTRIDHGLVPITSMSRKSGSLMPGLASAVSTMQLDPGDGEPIAIPGTLYSQVGLSGEWVSHYLLEAGSFNDAEATAGWKGADVSMTADASSRSIEYRGVVEPFFIESGGDSLRLGASEFEGDVEQTEFGFSVGSLSLNIDSVSMGKAAGEATSFGRLSLDTGSSLSDDRVNGKATMTVADLLLPGLGEIDMSMAVAVNGLDAQSIRTIVAAVRQAQGSNDVYAALAAVYPRIERDVQKILSSGAEIRVDRLDISLPQGEVTTKLRFALPETGASAEFSWPALILALTASADIRVPVALMEMAAAANPQSGTLVAMGILKKDGDAYIVDAEYQKGLLTVNGAPMPIPLPAR